MKASSISILVIGSEILDGRVQDTNSTFISSQLAADGISTSQILVCDDNIDEIIAALKYLSGLSNLVIVSGGLGPTSDDLTREAIARYSCKKLHFDEEEFENLRCFFEKRQRKLGENHKNQALIPEDAKKIENPVGTASGFVVETESLKIICLPGVPAELRAMFSSTVEQLILEHCGAKEKLNAKILRIFGLPESEVGDRIDALKLESDIFVSYRAMFPEIQVKLKTTRDVDFLAGVAAKVRMAIGEERIFSESLEQDFEVVLLKIFSQRHMTLATAESCTGGMLGKMLTSVPGSSSVYLGGVVSYGNDVKSSLLGVEARILEEKGAVSEEVALQMADGVRQRLKADYGVSITGIAGPDGGSVEKPVGTFYVGLSCAQKAFAKRYYFFSDRERVRSFACFTAIDLLRNSLLS